MHRMNGSAGRLFRLIRGTDPTGVAGTGHVASGVHWPDGSVTLKWHTPATLADPANVSHYANASKMIGIHGHSGRTRMEYVQSEPAPSGKLVKYLSDFCYELGDFAERVEKGLKPSADEIRKAFGRVLDVATEANTV